MRIATLLLLAAMCPAVLHAAALNWVAAWAAPQQATEPKNALPDEDRHDVTLRQIVRLSIGGGRLRLRIANSLGTGDLRLGGVHIGVATSPASPGIAAGTDHAVLFDGKPQVVIPAGAEYLSDPVDIELPAFASVAISLHSAELTLPQTIHPGSRATSYLKHGDQVSAAEFSGAQTIEHWFYIDRVDVETRGQPSAAIMLGDSITDGHGATTNGNNRWPDLLAERLQADPKSRHIAVLNMGLGGNRLLLDGAGPNAMARLDRDVLTEPHARFLIVFEGINDLGALTREAPAAAEVHSTLVRDMISGYAQIVARAHAHGLRVYGATLYPFMGTDYYHPDAANEADRQAVNQWIRARGHFDAVLDFDQVIRDPAHPERMSAQFDSGDHLHPSPVGMRALADAIPLKLFED